MEFKQLEAFAAVAEYRSFSRAAESLYLTQPTVSAHIRALENEVGVLLFHRTTKFLRLTANGERLLPYAQRMVELKKTALASMDASADKIVHIGASSIPSTYILPKLISEFKAIHTDFIPRISSGNSSEIENKVLDGTVDLGFIGEKVKSPGIISVPVMTDRLMLAVPSTRRFKELKASGASLEELLKFPFIIRSTGSATAKNVIDFLQSRGINATGLRIAAYSDNLESIINMVINEIGVAILSEHSIKEASDGGKIIVFDIGAPAVPRFHLIYKENRKQSPDSEAFIKFAASNTL